MMYMKANDLKGIFHCGDRTISKCRRYIADHPERYTRYGVVGNLTSALAFVDAYKYHEFNAGTIPPFDPRAAAVMLGRWSDV